MADLTRITLLQLATYLPPSSCQLTGLTSGEALAFTDACYIAADGLVWRSTGAAANAAAKVRGYASATVGVAALVDLFWDVVFTYSSGLTPGADYYLSGATPGALATAASTGGTLPIAYAVNATDVAVRRSTY